MSVMVETRDLTVLFGDFTAVKNVSFTVNQGEIFGFLGANGAGKTTTIRVLCGLLKPSSGIARIAGGDVDKSKVGYMSQKFTLYNDLTVEENLSFTADLRKIPRKVYQARKEALLEFISFSKPLNTMVADLPGGMKQQVSLAASLLHDPDIVFLDEPTAGVSPYSRSIFWNLIRDLASKGKTIFVTSHYMDEVEQCGRIALMRDGEIIALDSPAALKVSTFPKGIIELTPKGAVKPDPSMFLSCQHYGLRYHVIPKTPDLRGLEADFEIKTIVPSLEDVFIQQVERGAN